MVILVSAGTQHDIVEEKREYMTDKWLTVRELAQYLKISIDLVYKLTQQGKIPVSKVGNLLRFDREEIDAWVKSQRPAKVKPKK